MWGAWLDKSHTPVSEPEASGDCPGAGLRRILMQVNGAFRGIAVVDGQAELVVFSALENPGPDIAFSLAWWPRVARRSTAGKTR